MQSSVKAALNRDLEQLRVLMWLSLRIMDSCTNYGRADDQLLLHRALDQLSQFEVKLGGLTNSASIKSYNLNHLKGEKQLYFLGFFCQRVEDFIVQYLCDIKSRRHCIQNLYLTCILIENKGANPREIRALFHSFIEFHEHSVDTIEAQEIRWIGLTSGRKRSHRVSDMVKRKTGCKLQDSQSEIQLLTRYYLGEVQLSYNENQIEKGQFTEKVLPEQPLNKHQCTNKQKLINIFSVDLQRNQKCPQINSQVPANQQIEKEQQQTQAKTVPMLPKQILIKKKKMKQGSNLIFKKNTIPQQMPDIESLFDFIGKGEKEEHRVNAQLQNAKKTKLVIDIQKLNAMLGESKRLLAEVPVQSICQKEPSQPFLIKGFNAINLKCMVKLKGQNSAQRAREITRFKRKSTCLNFNSLKQFECMPEATDRVRLSATKCSSRKIIQSSSARLRLETDRRLLSQSHKRRPEAVKALFSKRIQIYSRMLRRLIA